mmetsp:Transcript_7957/g.16161  ORF Transcript_7957/g.16161 Transcript_7957/m.16161 type:complete len:201 (-) Transcript_7957:142-744(-)
MPTAARILPSATGRRRRASSLGMGGGGGGGGAAGSGATSTLLASMASTSNASSPAPSCSCESSLAAEPEADAPSESASLKPPISSIISSKAWLRLSAASDWASPSIKASAPPDSTSSKSKSHVSRGRFVPLPRLRKGSHTKCNDKSPIKMAEAAMASKSPTTRCESCAVGRHGALLRGLRRGAAVAQVELLQLGVQVCPP